MGARSAVRNARDVIRNSGKHMLQVGIFSRSEFVKVNRIFNESPLSLKETKPSSVDKQRDPGTLAAWKQCVITSKLAFISERTFPCQKASIFTDPVVVEKSLKTFSTCGSDTRSIHRKRKGQDDDRTVED